MNLDLFSYAARSDATHDGPFRHSASPRVRPASAKEPLASGSGEAMTGSPAASPTYPDAPGYKERGGTSQAAAEAMAPRAGTLRAMALDALRRSPQGLTADEIATACGVDRLAIRPRCTELKEAKLIRKTEDTRPNVSGHSAKIWVALPEVAK